MIKYLLMFGPCLNVVQPASSENRRMSMDSNATKDSNQSQTDKFKEAAREHEADEDEKHWEERLRKVANQKPAEEKPD